MKKRKTQDFDILRAQQLNQVRVHGPRWIPFRKRAHERLAQRLRQEHVVANESIVEVIHFPYVLRLAVDGPPALNRDVLEVLAVQ